MMMNSPTSQVQRLHEGRSSSSFKKALHFLRPLATTSDIRIIFENASVTAYSSLLDKQEQEQEQQEQQPVVHLNCRSRITSYIKNNISRIDSTKTDIEKGQNNNNNNKSNTEIEQSKVVGCRRRVQFNSRITVYITKNAPITDCEKRRMFYSFTDYKRMEIDGLRCCVSEESRILERYGRGGGGGGGGVVLSLDKFFLVESEFTTIRGLESFISQSNNTTGNTQSMSLHQKQQRRSIVVAVLNEQCRQRQYRVIDETNLAKVSRQVSRSDIKRAIDIAKLDEQFVMLKSQYTKKGELVNGKRRRSSGSSTSLTTTATATTTTTTTGADNNSMSNLSIRSHTITNSPTNLYLKKQSEMNSKDDIKGHNNDERQRQRNRSSQLDLFSSLPGTDTVCYAKIRKVPDNAIEKLKLMEI